MSSMAGAISLFRKLPSSIPARLWVPLLGAAWLAVNVALIGLGAQNPKNPSFSWSFLAGTIDGIVLSVFVINYVSEKLHAAGAGLLGGYGFQDVMNGYKVTKDSANWVHEQLLDPVLKLLINSTDEIYHRAVQSEIMRIGGTAALVILVALLIQLIRGAGARQQTTGSHGPS